MSDRELLTRCRNLLSHPPHWFLEDEHIATRQRLHLELATRLAAPVQPVTTMRDWKAPSEAPETGHPADVMMYAGTVGNPSHPGHPGKPWIEAATKFLGMQNGCAFFMAEVTQTGRVIAWRYAAAPTDG